MKKWICLLIACLLTACSACADEAAAVQTASAKMEIYDCRIQSGQSGAEITFEAHVRTFESAAQPLFMDVGRIAVSSGKPAAWQLTEQPMEESNLIMILLGSSGAEVQAQGALTLTGEIAYPLQIAFPVDFYEAINKTASLDLRSQTWRMVRSEDNDSLVEARPDLPHMNNNSNIPQILSDFDALVHPGESWEEQLSYIREHAALQRLTAKTYSMAKHAGAYEILITLESPDQPANIQIAKLP